MKLELTLIVKLASIAIHVEELFSTDGRNVDRMTVESLLKDSEVQAFLKSKDMKAFLPVKRWTA